MKGEKQRFLEEEWPKVLATINRLGFEAEELLKATTVEVTPSLTVPTRPTED
jgi:hypothetical protein